MTVTDVEPPPNEFSLNLVNFEGPFDLLLQLIAKHELDITEVALSAVTSEFISFVRSLDNDLEQTTNFLLVAATLLDLKAARMLPQSEVEDEDDLALLEARDLLFARLMQYRAFKKVAASFAERLETQSRRLPRQVTLEPRFAQLLPEVVISVGPEGLAQLAAGLFSAKPAAIVSLTHLHAPQVSVRSQVHLMVDQLRRTPEVTFRALTADAPDLMTKVARFLGLLELFREGVVQFDQATPLGDLLIRWTGSSEGDIDIGEEFDGGSPEAAGPEDAGPEETESVAGADDRSAAGESWSDSPVRADLGAIDG